MDFLGASDWSPELVESKKNSRLESRFRIQVRIDLQNFADLDDAATSKAALWLLTGKDIAMSPISHVPN